MHSLSCSFYLLAAVIVGVRKESIGSSYITKWADAFRSDQRQIDIFFGQMLDGFAYQRIICDAADNPIDYVFLDTNVAFEQMTGLSRGEIVGKKVTQVIPGIEHDTADWIGTFGKVAFSTSPLKFEIYSVRLKKWFRVSAYSPEKSYVISLYEDITDQKDMQKKIEDYSKNLEKLVEQRTEALRNAERLAAIGATAGMVGHDIRNPMQTVTGELFLIRSEIESLPDAQAKGRLRESLEVIDEQVNYVNKIIADLQDFARPLTPKIEDVDFGKTVNAVLTSIQVPANIQVGTSISEGFPEIKTDAAYIRRILQNLCNNAIQAMPKGGKMAITATLKDDSAVIVVEDTGGGIPVEVRGKLFTPLTTTKAKGQGFGLAVIKRLTEALGGTVTFETETGKGTKFIVKLPQGNI